jgi:hypothetical protein
VVAAAALEDLAAAAAVEAEPVVAGKNLIGMGAYVIDVSGIEELQNLNNKSELEKIFFKAQSTIVNGEVVKLVRKDKQGVAQKFDELSTLEDLERYKKSVFKYL